jgi:protocatechuate 3,4-dioxygenase beta subunit
MTKNIRLGLGLAVLLILGFWGWQSTNHLKSQPEKTAPKVLEVTPRRMETPVDPPPLSSSDLNQRAGENPGTVSGTVRVKSTGVPVAGASVLARNADSIPFESPLAYTDEKGSYTLTDIPSSIKLLIFYVDCPSGEYYLNWPRFDGKGNSEDAPSFVSLKPGEKKTGVNIYLSQGQPGSISGSVVGRDVHYLPPCDPALLPERKAAELAEEVALSGVRIILEQIPWGKKMETVTDKAGRFRLEKLKPAVYTVSAEQPEGFAYVPNARASSLANLIEKPVQDEMKFCFLKDGVAIEGRVLDSKGGPIEGAEITAFQSPLKPLPGSKFRVQKVTSALSNAQGEFRLNNLPVSDFNEGLDYLRKGESAWEFLLHCGANGFCPNQVRLAPYPNALIQAAMKFDEELIQDGALIDYKDVKLPGGQGNVITGVEVVLFSNGSVSGRVVDKQGRNLLSPDEEQKGVASIQLISLENPVTVTSIPILLRAGLVKDSCFHIENVPPGHYKFQINWEYYQGINSVHTRARNEPIAVHEGETIQDLIVIAESMADRGDIAGHVVDALTGQPVESPSVKVLRVDSPSEPEPQKGQVSTDNLPVGDFSIRALSAGKVTLEISAPGYTTIQAEAEVSSGQTTEQTFQMGGGGGLSGRVLDAETKEPVETFEVRVFPGEGENESKSFEGKIRKDEEKKGAFYLSGLPAGRMIVEIAKVPDRSNLTEEVEIVSGRMTEQTFLIQRKGTLVGQVTNSGKKVSDASVSVRMDRRTGRDEIVAWTNVEGNYKVEIAEVGKSTIRSALRYSCGFQDGTQVEILSRADVQIKPGEETRQDFDFRGSATIQGTVQSSDRNQYWFVLVLDGSVSTCDSIDPRINEKIRATAGNLQKGDRYEIRPLSPGDYTVFARCYTQNDRKVPVAEKIQSVTLTDDQTLTVDFNLP